MKILWIVNGLKTEQSIERHIAAATISSWTEALIDKFYLSRYNFEILYPILQGDKSEFIEGNLKYISFNPREENMLKDYRFNQYDMIHIWGLEYEYIPTLIKLLDKKKLLDRTILSIQGICEYVGKHYCDGLPERVIKRRTLRDWLKKDSIQEQQKRFLEKGIKEKETLGKLKYVSGRTFIDRQYVESTSKETIYYYCAEGLRETFYKNKWESNKCNKNRIFLSQGYYSIKGLHIALEAIYNLRKQSYDVNLVVAGMLPFSNKKYRDHSYARYIRELLKKYSLEESVEFLGQISEEKMLEEYLKCNIFIMPSLTENSPNSVCEAMMLGVPVVAAFVGGIPDLIRHKENGYLYQSNAPYMLTSYIKMLLDKKELCETIGKNARETAFERHNISTIMKRWDEIYEDISEHRK